MGGLMMSLAANKIFTESSLKFYNECEDQYPTLLFKSLGLKSQVKCFISKDNKPSYFLVEISEVDCTVNVFLSATLSEFHIKFRLLKDVVIYTQHHNVNFGDACAKCIEKTGRFMVIQDDCDKISGISRVKKGRDSRQTFVCPEHLMSKSIN
jgi:hypothetical protein